MSVHSPIPLKAGHGIWLPEAELWLDAGRGQPFSFVSHAHADHVARHQRVLCSRETARLLSRRFGSKAEMQALDFDEPWDWNGYRIVLTPAGHVTGSAMIHLTRLTDGASLLYTGDFKLRTGRTAEAARPLAADTLIMECTFGRPHYQFPPAEQVRAAMTAWCQDALDSGEVPVLLGYSFGKAQEIMAQLADGGFRFAVHPAVAEMNEACEALGVRLPPWEKFAGNPSGCVLVFPPSTVRSPALRKVKRRVTAMVSGWGMNPSARFQSQTDEVFPLSDHADYPQLLRLVEMVRPRLVLTTHGFSAEFASDLRQRGQEAWSLAGNDQRELDLALAPGVARAIPDQQEPAAESGSFAALCRVAEAVGNAPGRLRKTALLADFFHSLTDPADLATAARFLAGRVAATRTEQQAVQTGWAAIRHALLAATGHPLARYREVSRANNDAGRTTFLLLDGCTTPRPWDLADVQALYDSLRTARGATRKAAMLTDAFRTMSPMTGQYTVKILTGDTRIGLKEGLIEEALAAAFAVRSDSVREAHMLSGDIGETALEARAGTLDTVSMRPFQPVKVMLASPEDDAAGVWARLDGGNVGGGVWLEDKFDGIRAQLHVADGRAGIFSRDLRSLSAEFPDLVRIASGLPRDVVLDGEIIAWAEGRKLGFGDLQKRLGRREPDLFLTDDVPVRFIAFDVLWCDGRPLLDEPLTVRRTVLEGLALPDRMERIEVVRATEIEALHTAFRAAKARGNEGLIAKDPASPYAAGRRGKSWLKLKRSALTLDVVVVAAEQGHGKRSHVLSDYTFAVRDETSGDLRVIGKAYSGLTDREIEELTTHFRLQTLESDGRKHRVIPDVVLEVAFDSIRASKRHDSGLALRFPRIRGIRRDKSPDGIDTLNTARRLAEAAAD